MVDTNINFSSLKWIKNVRHQGKDRDWAYDRFNDFDIPEAKIFCLNWRRENKNNAEKPSQGELMVLLQNARVTHLVKFLDDKVYDRKSNDWGIYRVVQVLWFPPKGFEWKNLPHQETIFGYPNVVGDGKAHDLSERNGMKKFHQYWQDKGGLDKFQKEVQKYVEKDL